MTQNRTITVEVAYALPAEQCVLSVEVEEGATVAQVIERSGMLALFPQIDLKKQKVGIFSRLCELADLVSAGDRIEIYRPLTIDPKEARRKRVKKKV